jgi:hypothetical protein
MKVKMRAKRKPRVPYGLLQQLHMSVNAAVYQASEIPRAL